MNQKITQIQETINFVKSFHENDASGHDWFHIQRVTNLAKKIGEKEGGDLFRIEITALLHDVADYKLNNGDENKGIQKIINFLEKIEIDTSVIQLIISDIKNISFKGAEVGQNPLTKEGQIVQDADRIDAIGAIGIARAFAYGGNKNRMIYDPEQKPEMHTNFENYKKSTAPTINHFYEKLLLLKDRMHTVAAKQIAEERHLFMKEFLKQFYKEWEI